MDKRDKALCAVAEFELAMKGTNLPVLVLIGFPESGEFIRCSYGLTCKDTREVFQNTAEKYFDFIAARAEDQE